MPHRCLAYQGMPTKGLTYNLVEVEGVMVPQFYKRTKVVVTAEDILKVYKWTAIRSFPNLANGPKRNIDGTNVKPSSLILSVLLDMPLEGIVALVWRCEKENYISDDEKFDAFECFTLHGRQSVRLARARILAPVSDDIWRELLNGSTSIASTFRFLYPRRSKLN